MDCSSRAGAWRSYFAAGGFVDGVVVVVSVAGFSQPANNDANAATNARQNSFFISA